jgi:hypothetical protein
MMLTQSQLENKSLAPAAALESIATLRERAERLRADETRHEQQLHAGQSDLAAAEAGIADAMFAASKGVRSREAMTSWLFAQSAAQNKILVSIEALTKTRAELREANEALLAGEAHAAASEAAAFESEIVTELQAFAGEILSYWRRCERIQALRERARDAKLITPAVMEALFPNWGEVMSFSVLESRLELIAKCTEVPEEAAAIVHGNARERSRAAKAEIERGKEIEAERQRVIRKARNNGGSSTKLHYSFETKFDEEGKLVSREVFE